MTASLPSQDRPMDSHTEDTEDDTEDDTADAVSSTAEETRRDILLATEDIF